MNLNSIATPARGRGYPRPLLPRFSRPHAPWLGGLGSVIALALHLGAAHAQQPPRFTTVERASSGEVQLRLEAPTGNLFRIDVSAELSSWEPLVTFLGAGSNLHTDGTAIIPATRFYRARQLAGAESITGDHLATEQGDVVIHPVNHASLVLTWQGKTIYNDPVGGAGAFAGLPKADLILVSHTHGDHFDSATLTAVRGPTPLIIAPQAVFNSLSVALRAQTIVLTNGASTNILGLNVAAVPAYNANHPRGAGNGYVVTLGGRRLYFSGDTGDIAEMRSLQNIDVAFVCMNVPFTMTVEQAASAVREFRPRIVYPYHYRNQSGTLSDLADFKRRVADPNVEVRVRKWY